MDRWDIEKKIVLQALKDERFKKQLHENPKQALKELFKNEKGIDLSNLDGMQLKVYEESEKELLITLPHVEEGASHLSDADLNALIAAQGLGHARTQTQYCPFHPCGV